MSKILVTLEGDILELNRLYSFMQTHVKKITPPESTSIQKCEQLKFTVTI